ncbi:hypothetical protein [Kitasatospora fiedleri]|uniref:hypothetical protein n=1 Tax=Kitasatospora fiedleri TaxID=2991545 RepID=UPI00249C0C3E|nr:hypothetical protein [Kitasatospora fiedleri]
MRILLGAQSCGFGPISKLTAVSRALDGHHRVFTGVTVAADFAHRNADAFDEFVDIAADAGALDREIRRADWVVSVMDADLVFRAVAAGRPVLLVDSLLAFWKLDTPAWRIAELCELSRRTGSAPPAEVLAELSPHEQVFAAHLLADVSAAQNFPGVAERIAELRALGAVGAHLTGPIVDEPALADVPRATEDAVDLMVNIGGFKNFLLDYDHHNAYLHLVSRWIPDLLADWPRFDRVAVCGGSYGGDRAARVAVGGRTAEFRCLSHRAFIPAVASARHYLLTPGLTAIHEALLLGHFPMALPEQHYGHISNLEGLAGTLFERHGSRFSDLIPGYEVPADDFEGTAAIVGHVGRLLADDGGYALFRRGMNERIESFVDLGPEDRADGVAELRALLQGPSFSALLGEVLPAPADELVGGAR